MFAFTLGINPLAEMTFVLVLFEQTSYIREVVEPFNPASISHYFTNFTYFTNGRSMKVHNDLKSIFVFQMNNMTKGIINYLDDKCVVYFIRSIVSKPDESSTHSLRILSR